MRELDRPSNCHTSEIHHKDPVSDTPFCMSKQVYNTLYLLTVTTPTGHVDKAQL